MKRLTLERQRRGWSKAEVARRAGLHPSQIGWFESGRMVPYDSSLRKIAAAFGMDESEAPDLLEEVSPGALERVAAR